MSAKYLIRLDDACPTMDIEKWNLIEQCLDKHNLKPLVAVIPDCKDESLHFNEPVKDFWQIVKRWKSKGWTIGMHGYQHVYVELKDKKKSLVPIHNRTEFAGLPYEVQKEKIEKAWKIFLSQGIKPDVWVAPAHTFDLNTLKALEKVTEIRIVSDCFAFYPFKYNHFFFVPQQLWKFIRFPFGVWTICLHPNTMSKDDFNKLELWLQSSREHFVNFFQVELKNRSWTALERFINHNFWFDDNKKKWFKIIKRWMK